MPFAAEAAAVDIEFMQEQTAEAAAGSTEELEQPVARNILDVIARAEHGFVHCGHCETL